MVVVGGNNQQPRVWCLCLWLSLYQYTVYSNCQPACHLCGIKWVYWQPWVANININILFVSTLSGPATEFRLNVEILSPDLLIWENPTCSEIQRWDSSSDSSELSLTRLGTGQEQREEPSPPPSSPAWLPAMSGCNVEPLHCNYYIIL